MEKGGSTVVDMGTGDGSTITVEPSCLGGVWLMFSEAETRKLAAALSPDAMTFGWIIPQHTATSLVSAMQLAMGKPR